MYEPDTILKLKEPRSVGEPDSEDYEAFPYDVVKVVGPSPINHGGPQSEWIGSEGSGVIITPINGFGSTLDEPFGKLQSLYEVESIPEREIELGAPVKVITPGTAGPTPEEVFAKEAPADPDKRSKHGERVRSPLDGPSTSSEVTEKSADETVGVPQNNSPLG